MEKLFDGSEVQELCDSVKSIHEVLKTIGLFLSDIDSTAYDNGNAVIADFKKWGVKMVSREMLAKQFQTLDRIIDIYREEQQKLIR